MREHFEAGFAIFPSGFPCVVGNDEPGASYRWRGWSEAVLADAWGGLCGEETGCGKRALRVGWRVQCGACVIAACCVFCPCPVAWPEERIAARFSSFLTNKNCAMESTAQHFCFRSSGKESLAACPRPCMKVHRKTQRTATACAAHCNVQWSALRCPMHRTASFK